MQLQFYLICYTVTIYVWNKSYLAAHAPNYIVR
jgi:hypothetical protein